MNSIGNAPWSYPNTRSDFFDEHSVFRKDKKIEENLNTTLEKFQRNLAFKETERKLWESNPLWKYSYLPNEEFDQYDLDNFTIKTKWPSIKTKLPFRPSNTYGDYFEKPL